jgi:acyl-CoA synthetase (AMP-forming)/AMP-acid ligase II
VAGVTTAGGGSTGGAGAARGVSLGDLLPPPGGELCVHAAGRDHSRTEVRARVDEVARALGDAGVEAGAPVGVLLPSGAEAVAALFAVWRAGGVHVPLNPRFTDTELTRVLGQVGAAAVVTTAGLASRVADRPTVVLDGDTVRAVPRGHGFRTGEPEAIGRAYGTYDLDLPETEPIASADRPDRRDRPAMRHERGVAIVSFTSGTTGPPTPVPLLHAAVLEGIDQVLGTLRARPGGGPPMPNLVPVSLSLWAGIYQVLFAFRAGAPVVVMEGFDTATFAGLVRRFAIRSTVLPPAAMVMLVDDERVADLAPLRYVRSISSPLSPLQARRFRDRFGIRVLNGYGQTELGGEVVGWSAADSKAFGDAKLGSVGRPHAGVEVDVDGATGELLVRIPGRTDGWHRTGDVARIDEDGFVWIEGRVSDMVNRGGLKVHPGEVEEVLRLSPAVADAAVVGVPDDRLGEVPVAFVVVAGHTGEVGQPDQAHEGGPAGRLARSPGRWRALDEGELEALCRRHLAPYKVPVRFERVDALPRNEAGKLLRRELA